MPVMLGYITLLVGLNTVFDLSSAENSAMYQSKGKCTKNLYNKFILPN